jgi:hypothetical protein
MHRLLVWLFLGLGVIAIAGIAYLLSVDLTPPSERIEAPIASFQAVP